MMLGQMGREVAVLAVVCVAAIFFFPAIQGPYSAVNGPVTALQSAQAAARLRVAIIQSAFNLLGNFHIPRLAWVSLMRALRTQFQVPDYADCSAILRC
jgi:hypothetical protein